MQRPYEDGVRVCVEMLQRLLVRRWGATLWPVPYYLCGNCLKGSIRCPSTPCSGPGVWSGVSSGQLHPVVTLTVTGAMAVASTPSPLEKYFFFSLPQAPNVLNERSE